LSIFFNEKSVATSPTAYPLAVSFVVKASTNTPINPNKAILNFYISFLLFFNL